MFNDIETKTFQNDNGPRLYLTLSIKKQNNGEKD